MKGKYLILSLVPVLLLSGCKWFGSSDAKKAGVGTEASSSFPEGVLAVWADGTALITQKEFDEMFDLLIKGRPELQSMAAVIKPQVLPSMVQARVVGKYIIEKGIDKSDEYKALFDNAVKNIKQQIDFEFFAKEFDVKVTEKDKKDFYDANKDRFPGAVRGGVKAEGVKFEKEADAKAFLSKAGQVAAFDKSVKADSKLAKTLQDFNYVNDGSVQMDPILKKEILAIGKIPSVIMVKVNDKTFWVVKATEKKAPKYPSYEELKGQLEGAVKQTKQQEAFIKRLGELQTQYGVKIKENAFAPKPTEMPAPVAPEGKVADASGAEQAETAVAQSESQDLEKATKAA